MTLVSQRTVHSDTDAPSLAASHHEEHVLDETPLYLDDFDGSHAPCRSECQATLRRARRARNSVSLLAGALLGGGFVSAVIIVELAK